MIDIAIVSVPYTIIEVPPLALAVLKGAIEAEGMKCKTYDLGMELFVHMNRDRRLFEDVQLYFYEPDQVDKNENADIAVQFIDMWAKKLIELDTKWIGISVFSSYAQPATYLLAKRIKELKPDAKIIVGGNGAGVGIIESAYNLFDITSLEKILKFDDFVKKRKIVDLVIQGDGETPLVDLLSEKAVDDSTFFYSKYNENEFPFANFDDFRLKDYEGQDGYIQLPIFSSKGCVRNCDFCDVNSVQGHKYRFRTGKNIVSEIIYLSEKYKINDFLFLDSLANGNLKNLREMVQTLADYNEAHPDNKIRWNASGWICRPAGQIKPEFYDLMGKSGLQSVSIGIETGSNNVLEAMRKKTNVEGVYWDAENFKRNNIKFIALMMVGHWAETWEDFLDTCVLMFNLSKYARSGTLSSAQPGLTFGLETDVPAWTDKDSETGGRLVRENKMIWWSPKNPTLTFKERYSRWLLFHKLLHVVKIPVMTEEPARAVYHRIVEHLEKAKVWYSDIIEEHGIKVENVSGYYNQNWDEFMDLVVDKSGAKEKPIELELNITSSTTIGDLPGLTIELNNETVYTNTFSEGDHSIKIPNINKSSINNLSIRFFNKGPNDTIVDENGNVTKDKFITINKFIVDGLDLISDPDYFYQFLTYVENDQPMQSKAGFWINDSILKMQFENPFLRGYNEKSNRFSQFSVFMIIEASKPGARLEKIDPDYYRNKIISELKALPL